MSEVVLTPIGTCRINGPLRRSAEIYGFSLNLARVYGYTHSSAEALQQIRYLQGDYKPSSDVLPILFRPAAQDDDGIEHQLSDLYFVEISSAKLVSVGSDWVQANYLSRHFSEFFADRARERKYWSLATPKHREERDAFLKSDVVYRSYVAADRSLLRRMTMRTASADDLKRDMAEITARLGNDRTIFVTHFDARTPDGSQIASRSKWIKSIKTVASELGARVFDPTTLMETVGQAEALENQGFDLTHYAPAHEERVYEDWHQTYVSALLDARGITGGNSADAAVRAMIADLRHLHARGQIITVFKRVHAALRSNPENMPLRLLLGELQFEIGDYAGAIQNLEAAVSALGRIDEADTMLMCCHFELGQWSEALRMGDGLLLEERESDEILRICAQSAERLGQPRHAARFWRRLFELDTHLVEAALALSRIEERHGEHAAALKWSTEVVRREPNCKEALERLVRQQAKLGDEEALSATIRGLASSDPAQARAAIAVAVEHKLPAAAAQGVSHMLAVNPVDREVRTLASSLIDDWATDGAGLIGAGQVEAGLRLFRATLIISPRHGVALRALREFGRGERLNVRDAFQRRDFQAAIVGGTRLLSLGIDAPDMLSVIGRAYFSIGDYGAAQLWLTRATGENEQDSTDWMFRARAAYRLEDYADARLSYCRVLDLAEHAEKERAEEARRHLALIPMRAARAARRLVQDGRLEDAWAKCDVARAAEPENQLASRTANMILGTLRRQLIDLPDDDGHERVRVARSIVEKDPHNQLALRTLGSELMRLRRFDNALPFWERLERLAPNMASATAQIEKCRLLLSRNSATAAN